MLNIVNRFKAFVPMNKLYKNIEIAERKLTDLKNELTKIKQAKIEEKIIEITNENKLLTSEVEKAKVKLIQLEISNGKKQYKIPGKTDAANNIKPIEKAVTAKVEEKENVKPPVKKEKKESKPKTVAPASSDTNIDVSKLDFRIGKIIDINKHPDADSLYVEKIDCGEPNPRTVVSGLVNYVPIDEMRDRIVMVLCNLKPVKMRGVTSEAMVMCASTEGKVEVLVPPPASIPGDLVSCDGYPRTPEPQLNPKKKIFETCAPDLKTNSDRVACYKDKPLVVEGKGPVLAPTLTGVNVK